MSTTFPAQERTVDTHEALCMYCHIGVEGENARIHTCSTCLSAELG